VLYHQGLDQLRLGRDRWASSYFQKLPPASEEARRARFTTLVAKLKSSRDVTPKLMDELVQLSKEQGLSLELRNQIFHSLARLHFEKKNYAEALVAYRDIQLPPLETGRAALYLEEAWTRYHLGQLREAMGLLTTLDAPTFRSEFLPDKYLLRAFIYRDLCQYPAARRASRVLAQSYAGTLEAIRSRQGILGDPRLVRAAVASGDAGDAFRFLRSVEAERKVLQQHPGVGEALGARLDELYSLAWSESARRYRAALEVAAEAKANELLAAAEQARLMDYEVGLKLYERARGKAKPVAATSTALPEPARAAIFQFKGEYWNDELRDYQFKMDDRCSEAAHAEVSP
jgi:hypothetical protein